MAYIRNLNLPPIRFVQFVPRLVPRCHLYSFIISMSVMFCQTELRGQVDSSVSKLSLLSRLSFLKNIANFPACPVYGHSSTTDNTLSNCLFGIYISRLIISSLYSGLYLSDIPIHDATRDLILLSEHRNAECALTQRLQIVTDKLQQTARELKKEQQLADKLLYSILPPSVANELRLKRPVKASKFEVVTVLFSGIVNFSQYCNDITEPMEIVSLLNNVYLTFDNLMDKYEDVYKVNNNRLRRLPTVFSKKLNKELHMLFFRDIYDLNETKRSILVNQRLRFTK